MGLIGGGILAATKGFAQGGARPADIQDIALTASSFDPLTLFGRGANRSQIDATEGMRDASAELEGSPRLRLDTELGYAGLALTLGKSVVNAPQDAAVPLKASASLNMRAGPGTSPHVRSGDVLVPSGLIDLPALAMSRDIGSMSGNESKSEHFGLTTVSADSSATGVAIPAGRDQNGPTHFPLTVTRGLSRVRLSAAEESPAPEAPVPMDTVVPGPSPGRQGTQGSPARFGGGPTEVQLPDLGDPGYRLAPIRWGGTTGTNVVWTQDSIGSQSLSNTQNLDMRAASYIYQPWFARVGGNFGVTMAESKMTAGGGGGGNNKNNSTSFNYGGDLSLFPVSRFPFTANFSQNSNLATAQDQASKSTSTRFGAIQNYRPAEGTGSYAANYDRSSVTTNTGNSLVNTAGASYAGTFGDHSVSSSVRYATNSGDVGGQSLQQFGINAAHTWRDDEDLMVSSSANFSNSQTNILVGGATLLNASRLWQANSSVTWTPDPDIPLTVTGGGSVYNVQTDTGKDKNQQLSMNGNANATYRFSPNLGVTGSATLGRNQSTSSNGGSTSIVSSSQTVSANYSGDPLKLYDFSYSWNTGGSFSNFLSSGSSGGGQSLSGQTVGANAGHSLSRVFSFSPVNTLNTSASQSFGLTRNSSSGLTNSTLTHSVGGSWRSVFSESLVASLGVSGSDSLSTGQGESHFRTVAVNGSGQWQVNRRAGFNANVNATWTQQVSSSSNIADSSLIGPNLTVVNNNTQALWTGGGSVAYNHRNPFNIQNLLYGATYSFTTSQTNLRVAAGDPDALSWVVSNTLMMRLDYLLGRVKFQLTGSLATIDGKNNTALFFSMQRAFGDF